MRPIDVVVCGSVAVNRFGARIGKGAGYSDLEVALLIEAGLVTDDTAIVAPVHGRQVIETRSRRPSTTSAGVTSSRLRVEGGRWGHGAGDGDRGCAGGGALAGVTAIATSGVQDVYAQVWTWAGRLFRRRSARVDQAGSQGGSTGWTCGAPRGCR